MSFDDRCTRWWLGLVALAGTTALVVAGCGMSGDDTSPGGAQAMADAGDPFGEDVAADSLERSQIGDCVHVYESDGGVQGRLVGCKSRKADYRIYNFATGTLDESRCPLDPHGRAADFWYQLDFPGSRRDDYVICGYELSG